MPQLTEQQAAEYIKSLYELEHEPDAQRAIIHLGPFTTFVLIGALQLAMRHPEFSKSQAELLALVIDQMKPLFAGTIAEQLLELGDHPEYDVPRNCQYPFGSHAPECPPGDHAGTGIDILPHDEATSYCTSIPGGCPVHPDTDKPGPDIYEYQIIRPDGTVLRSMLMPKGESASWNDDPPFRLAGELITRWRLLPDGDWTKTARFPDGLASTPEVFT